MSISIPVMQEMSLGTLGEERTDDRSVLFGYCPPHSNSWIIIIIGLYIAFNRTPNVDCYWGGSTQCVVIATGH